MNAPIRIAKALEHWSDRGYSLRSASALPTVFHITHWKSGSQWIHRIFHGIAYERLVLPNVEQTQFFSQPIQSGMIYPTLYVTRQEFELIQVPRFHRKFVVIRDLRDTLVSYAFSLLHSHSEDCSVPGFLANFRAEFKHRPLNDVLTHVMNTLLPLSAAIQSSWINHGELTIRYEDLLKGDIQLMTEIFIKHCQIPISREKLTEIILANRFEKLTGGRPRGKEDVLAHERKGIVGDWRNYFSDQLKRSFKDRYAELLIATGYESSSDW